jgi:hypothetical protein
MRVLLFVTTIIAAWSIATLPGAIDHFFSL